MANEDHVARLRQGVTAWNEWRRKNPGVKPDLSETDLRREDFSGVNLSEANLGASDLRGVFFSGADLRKANLFRTLLSVAFLDRADLSEATLAMADASNTDFSEATLSQADLSEANLYGADLFDADLSGANLSGAFLSRANLSGATLSRANLEEAVLVGADLERVNLTGCRVYGISAWNVKLTGAQQADLVITPADEPVITVDNLEVAQFIYLLLENKKIRDIIGTVTSRAVLILGRFTKRRKPVLKAVHSALRDNHGLVPILFDFEPSPKRDLTETIQLLANMCRFVVADVTDAKSIPQELSHIIPFLPAVPVQPIILAAQNEYVLFEHWRKFNSVLPEFLYWNKRHLLANLEACVIKPVERWEAEVKKAAAKERLLQERIKKLEAENAKLRGLQSARPDTSG